jgi:hypothetical protein
MSLIEMEAEIDRLNLLMCAAYDRGDMREWERLCEQMQQIGRQYRARMK